jgi:hypothetical protein
MPKEGEYFLSFDKAISNASIKHKFFFKTSHKEPPAYDIRVLRPNVPGLVLLKGDGDDEVMYGGRGILQAHVEGRTSRNYVKIME